MRAKKLLSLLLVCVMLVGLFPASVFAASYGDTQGHWAQAAIDRWSDYGIVTGDGQGFRPNDNMTRAEAATVFSRLFGLSDAAAKTTFTDVAAKDWFYEAVNKCVNAGIMNGVGDNMMNPNGTMTREMFFVMFARALGLKEQSSTRGLTADGDSWANGYINALTDRGYVRGMDGKVNALANIDRASVMALLDQTIKQYVNTSGTTTLNADKGVVLVNAKNVTLTGTTAADVVIAQGADGGNVDFVKATVTGAVTAQAANATITSDKDSKITAPVINGANTTYTAAGAATVSGGGGSSGGGYTPEAFDYSSADIWTTADGGTAVLKAGKSYETVTVHSTLGNGAVVLGDNTRIKNLIVEGGGSSSIYLTGRVTDITVNSTETTPRIAVNEGASVDGTITAQTATILESEGGSLSGAAVNAQNDVTIQGATEVGTVSVAATGETVNITLAGTGTISEVNTAADSSATITAENGGSVATVNAGSDVTVNAPVTEKVNVTGGTLGTPVEVRLDTNAGTGTKINASTPAKLSAVVGVTVAEVTATANVEIAAPVTNGVTVTGAEVKLSTGAGDGIAITTSGNSTVTAADGVKAQSVTVSGGIVKVDAPVTGSVAVTSAATVTVTPSAGAPNIEATAAVTVNGENGASVGTVKTTDAAVELNTDATTVTVETTTNDTTAAVTVASGVTVAKVEAKGEGTTSVEGAGTVTALDAYTDVTVAGAAVETLTINQDNVGTTTVKVSSGSIDTVKADAAAKVEQTSGGTGSVGTVEATKPVEIDSSVVEAVVVKDAAAGITVKATDSSKKDLEIEVASGVSASDVTVTTDATANDAVITASASSSGQEISVTSSIGETATVTAKQKLNPSVDWSDGKKNAEVSVTLGDVKAPGKIVVYSAEKQIITGNGKDNITGEESSPITFALNDNAKGKDLYIRYEPTDTATYTASGYMKLAYVPLSITAKSAGGSYAIVAGEVDSSESPATNEFTTYYDINGGLGDVSYSFDGTVPNGVTIDRTTGVITDSRATVRRAETATVKITKGAEYRTVTVALGAVSKKASAEIDTAAINVYTQGATSQSITVTLTGGAEIAQGSTFKVYTTASGGTALAGTTSTSGTIELNNESNLYNSSSKLYVSYLAGEEAKYAESARVAVNMSALKLTVSDKVKVTIAAGQRGTALVNQPISGISVSGGWGGTYTYTLPRNTTGLSFSSTEPVTSTTELSTISYARSVVAPAIETSITVTDDTGNKTTIPLTIGAVTEAVPTDAKITLAGKIELTYGVTSNETEFSATLSGEHITGWAEGADELLKTYFAARMPRGMVVSGVTINEKVATVKVKATGVVPLATTTLASEKTPLNADAVTAKTGYTPVVKMVETTTTTDQDGNETTTQNPKITVTRPDATAVTVTLSGSGTVTQGLESGNLTMTARITGSENQYAAPTFGSGAAAQIRAMFTNGSTYFAVNADTEKDDTNNIPAVKNITISADGKTATITFSTEAAEKTAQADKVFDKVESSAKPELDASAFAGATGKATVTVNDEFRLTLNKSQINRVTYDNGKIETEIPKGTESVILKVRLTNALDKEAVYEEIKDTQAQETDQHQAQEPQLTLKKNQPFTVSVTAECADKDAVTPEITSVSLKNNILTIIVPTGALTEGEWTLTPTVTETINGTAIETTAVEGTTLTVTAKVTESAVGVAKVEAIDSANKPESYSEEIWTQYVEVEKVAGTYESSSQKTFNTTYTVNVHDAIPLTFADNVIGMKLTGADQWGFPDSYGGVYVLKVSVPEGAEEVKINGAPPTQLVELDGENFFYYVVGIPTGWKSTDGKTPDLALLTLSYQLGGITYRDYFKQAVYDTDLTAYAVQASVEAINSSNKPAPYSEEIWTQNVVVEKVAGTYKSSSQKTFNTTHTVNVYDAIPLTFADNVIGKKLTGADQWGFPESYDGVYVLKVSVPEGAEEVKINGAPPTQLVELDGNHFFYYVVGIPTGWQSTDGKTPDLALLTLSYQVRKITYNEFFKQAVYDTDLSVQTATLLSELVAANDEADKTIILNATTGEAGAPTTFTAKVEGESTPCTVTLDSVTLNKAKLVLANEETYAAVMAAGQQDLSITVKEGAELYIGEQPVFFKADTDATNGGTKLTKGAVVLDLKNKIVQFQPGAEATIYGWPDDWIAEIMHRAKVTLDSENAVANMNADKHICVRAGGELYVGEEPAVTATDKKEGIYLASGEVVLVPGNANKGNDAKKLLVFQKNGENGDNENENAVATVYGWNEGWHAVVQQNSTILVPSQESAAALLSKLSADFSADSKLGIGTQEGYYLILGPDEETEHVGDHYLAMVGLSGQPCVAFGGNVIRIVGQATVPAGKTWTTNWDGKNSYIVVVNDHGGNLTVNGTMNLDSELYVFGNLKVTGTINLIDKDARVMVYAENDSVAALIDKVQSQVSGWIVGQDSGKDDNGNYELFSLLPEVVTQIIPANIATPETYEQVIQEGYFALEQDRAASYFWEEDGTAYTEYGVHGTFHVGNIAKHATSSGEAAPSWWVGVAIPQDVVSEILGASGQDAEIGLYLGYTFDNATSVPETVKVSKLNPQIGSYMYKGHDKDSYYTFYFNAVKAAEQESPCFIVLRAEDKHSVKTVFYVIDFTEVEQKETSLESYLETAGENDAILLDYDNENSKYVVSTQPEGSEEPINQTTLASIMEKDDEKALSVSQKLIVTSEALAQMATDKVKLDLTKGGKLFLEDGKHPVVTADDKTLGQFFNKKSMSGLCFQIGGIVAMLDANNGLSNTTLLADFARMVYNGASYQTIKNAELGFKTEQGFVSSGWTHSMVVDLVKVLGESLEFESLDATVMKPDNSFTQNNAGVSGTVYTVNASNTTTKTYTVTLPEQLTAATLDVSDSTKLFFQCTAQGTDYAVLAIKMPAGTVTVTQTNPALKTAYENDLKNEANASWWTLSDAESKSFIKSKATPFSADD